MKISRDLAHLLSSSPSAILLPKWRTSQTFLQSANKSCRIFWINNASTARACFKIRFKMKSFSTYFVPTNRFYFNFLSQVISRWINLCADRQYRLPVVCCCSPSSQLNLHCKHMKSTESSSK